MSDGGLYFPPPHGEGVWERVDPAEEGWDAEALDSTAAWLGANDSDAFVVLDRGRIVVDQRWNNDDEMTSSDVFSAQKSVVSLAVNSLLARGEISLEEPVSTWLGLGWTEASRSQEELITLRHLLTMTSGLYDDFGFEAAPGTIWYYNNNAYHQLRHVISTATGTLSNDLFTNLIFAPLGMASARWSDRQGAADPAGRPLAGLFMTALDLARFGLAVLAGGRWAATELLGDDAFLRSALLPSQSLNPSYGQLWWLLDQPSGIVPGSPRDGEFHPRKSFGGRQVGHALAPSAPAGTVAAMGAGDQRLYVLRREQIVVVRVGRSVYDRTAAAGNADEHLWQLLTPALPTEGKHR